MFNDPEFFDTCVEKMHIQMKRKSIFYELPYWENLNIGHLLYPMHIFKNVSFFYGGTYHGIKVTHCFSGEILLIQILKRDMGQETKLDERFVPHGILKKAMSHGF
jgi:hypothetical protein